MKEESGKMKEESGKMKEESGERNRLTLNFIIS